MLPTVPPILRSLAPQFPPLGSCYPGRRLAVSGHAQPVTRLRRGLAPWSCMLGVLVSVAIDLFFERLVPIVLFVAEQVDRGELWNSCVLHRSWRYIDVETEDVRS